MKWYQEGDVEELIDNSIAGKNTSFLKASHSLWKRFKNYDSHPPFVLIEDNDAVAIIFATNSKRTNYINLYEIVTIQGHERKGYGSKIWNQFVKYWANTQMERIKLSCTPDSIGFHIKNGLVFWSVDNSGSLRSDQPLLESAEQQIKLREKSLSEPNLVMPEKKVCEKLKKEDIENLKLSQNKLLKTYDAIQKADKYWLRKHLYD